MSNQNDINANLLARVNELLLLHEAGDMTQEQLAEFEHLLLSYPAARRLFALLTYESVEIAATLESDREQAQEVAIHQSSLTTHQSSIRTWDRALWRHRFGVGIAAGAFFVAALLGWAAMTYVPGLARNNGAEQEEVVFVAQLIHAAEAKWNVTTVEHPATHENHEIATGVKLFPGQKLSLAAGAALIKFKNGAEVLLEGPAEFEVGSEKTCRLEFGKLVARCRFKRSQGFVVQTPSAHVTDLGTEFGVEVAMSGLSMVRVYDGLVSVQPSDGSDVRELAVNEAATLTLAANGAVLFAPATVAAHTFMRPRSGTNSIGEHIHNNTVQTDLYSPQMNSIPVAKDDLVGAGAATLAAANPIAFVSNQNLDFKYINDGLSAARGQGVFEFEGHDGAQWIAEFVLDTSTNTNGYDITQIDSIASWIQGRIQQHVTVTYSTVDEPNQFKNLLGTFTNTHKVPQATGSSRIRLTDKDGGVLATRVKAVRLHYSNYGLGRNYLPVLQEVDVFGSATPSADQEPKKVVGQGLP